MKDKQLADKIVKLLDQYAKDEIYGVPEFMKLFEEYKQDLIKKGKGLKIELSEKERKLAKEVGCLQRSEDQVLFNNQAVDNFIKLLDAEAK